MPRETVASAQVRLQIESLQEKFRGWNLQLMPLGPHGEKILVDPQNLSPAEAVALQLGTTELSSVETNLLDSFGLGVPVADIADALGVEQTILFDTLEAIQRRLNPDIEAHRLVIKVISRYLRG